MLIFIKALIFRLKIYDESNYFIYQLAQNVYEKIIILCLKCIENLNFFIVLFHYCQ
jgi:hypothetical protein